MQHESLEYLFKIPKILKMTEKRSMGVFSFFCEKNSIP